MSTVRASSEGGADMHDRIEKALERVRTTLREDGFDLALQSVEPDGSANIALEAKEDACTDCLVPEKVLIGILEREISSEEPSIKKVVLSKSNFPEA